METNKIKERFDLIAQKYDEQRRFFIPCFDDYYQTTVSFLSEIRPSFGSILDLGAGTGLLTKYLFEKYSDARFTLMDVSEQMLDVARQRFSNAKNFNFVINDYTIQLPEKQFDLIASALSIHHLDEKLKASLYLNIYKHLPDNGFFMNLDQFNAGSELINEYYNKFWYSYIKRSVNQEEERESWLRRRELDKENSISETIKLLKIAGFRHAECIYSYMKFGVILAIK